MPNPTAIVIGAGFAGLSAAAYLGKAGYQVTILEKNSQAGGRARSFEAQGFRFDMGPSWYWMPDVFDRFFLDFGAKTSDFYQLKRLSPSYRIFFGQEDITDLPSDINSISSLFESMEQGSAAKLDKFLRNARLKYEIGMKDIVYKPGLSYGEFAHLKMLPALFKLNLFSSFHSYVRRYFKDKRIISMLEFPVLFLGGQPRDIPALYSLMNYADFVGGSWYPMGGMHRIVEALVKVAKQQGAALRLNEEVLSIESKNGSISRVITAKETYNASVVVGGSDYHHIEQQLLKNEDRTYTKRYWDSRKLAPSCVIYYLGLNKKPGKLLHHNLFFDRDFEKHAADIYETPAWPDEPLFYVCAASKTDPSVAPGGMENLFILIPTAPGLADTEELREKYFDKVMQRMELLCGENIRENIIFRRDYAHNDFVADYHSFRGNAYGLANTLMQTANLKPRIRSRKIGNLFFTGQMTVPGPGIPPSLISGKVVADSIIKNLKFK